MKKNCHLQNHIPIYLFFCAERVVASAQTLHGDKVEARLAATSVLPSVQVSLSSFFSLRLSLSLTHSLTHSLTLLLSLSLSVVSASHCCSLVPPTPSGGEYYVK